MIRAVAKALGMLALALALALISAWWMIFQAPRSLAVSNGPWRTSTVTGGTNADLYTRATVAMTGLFLHRVAAGVGYNHVVFPPLATDKSRDVVKPSPDLLYALCVFDLSAGPVRISAKPSEGYWSMALYARNSDNFFHLNDREVRGDRVELILSDARDDVALRARYPDAIHVHPGSTVGLMLARSLVLDANDMKAVIDARSSTRCTPLQD